LNRVVQSNGSFLSVDLWGDRKRANLSTAAAASFNPGGLTAAIPGAPAAAAAESTTATVATASLPPERKTAKGGLSSGTSRRGDFVGLIERLELENRMGPTVGGSSSDASLSGEEEDDEEDDDNDNGSEAEGDSSETASGTGGGAGGSGGSGGSGSDAACGANKSKPKGKKKRKRERRHSFDYEDDFIDDSALVEAYYAKVYVHRAKP